MKRCASLRRQLGKTRTTPGTAGTGRRRRWSLVLPTCVGEAAGAGEGNRTLVCSLGSCRSAIELRPQTPLFRNLALLTPLSCGAVCGLPYSRSEFIRQPRFIESEETMPRAMISGSSCSAKAEHPVTTVAEGYWIVRLRGR